MSRKYYSKYTGEQIDAAIELTKNIITLEEIDEKIISNGERINATTDKKIEYAKEEIASNINTMIDTKINDAGIKTETEINDMIDAKLSQFENGDTGAY